MRLAISNQAFKCPTLSNARKLQVSLPNPATAQELFNSVAPQGDIGLDHSAMVLALEKLAEFKIAQYDILY